MKRKLILPSLLIMMMAACGDADQGKPVKETTSSASTHEEMNHSPVAKGVPELPAIPAGASLFFNNLKDGATVSSPLKIEMGVSGIKVDTAGPVLAGVGHHHILIDAGDSLSAGTIVPMDSAHLHFGKAQTQAEVKLSPGKHRITLQFADGLHRSYGSAMATSVTVTVK